MSNTSAGHHESHWRYAPINMLLHWIRTRSALQELHSLDDAALKDMGITRCDIYRITQPPELENGVPLSIAPDRSDIRAYRAMHIIDE